MITEKNISMALRKLGIPPSFLGFDYIVTAIKIIDENNHYRHDSCKLYDEIAKQHNVGFRSCERAMRHAIEISFEYAGSDVIEEMFGNAYSPSRDRPTVSEFLACLYEYLRYDA